MTCTLMPLREVFDMGVEKGSSGLGLRRWEKASKQVLLQIGQPLQGRRNANAVLDWERVRLFAANLCKIDGG